MIAKNYEPWEVRESDFPHLGQNEEKLRFLLRYATLAPSGPNSQPWKFSLSGSAVFVFADLRRRLPFVDPSDRTLYISVGCAIANLMAAARHFEFSPRPSFFPRGLDSDLVAEVRLEPGSRPREDLFSQIQRRHTTKDRYEERAIDESTLHDLEGCIHGLGFYLHCMTDATSKEWMVDLVARAHRVQLADREFRRNLGTWLRNNWTTEPDGMPLYTFGIPDAIALGFPAAFREFDLSDVVIHRDSGLIRGCGALAVLASDQDDKLAWARCGVMLENLLLKATAFDIQASFFSQPIGVANLRGELQTFIGQGHPQLLFGLGFSKPVRHTPRRPLEDAMVQMPLTPL